MSSERCPVTTLLECSQKDVLEEILVALKGKDLDKTGGLVGRLENIEQRLGRLEALLGSVQRLAWALGIPVALAAMFGAFNFVKVVWVYVNK